MDINVIVGGLLVATLGYFVAYAFFNADKPPPEHVLPWVPIDVRKTKVYVSQTRDAGMYVERQRRVAIIGNRTGPFGYKGADNGSLEAYLTGICLCPAPVKPICPPAPNVIWDGGNASTEAVCAIVDGGSAGSEYEIVDFGNADTNVCA
jgi:hypothetical protein